MKNKAVKITAIAAVAAAFCALLYFTAACFALAGEAGGEGAFSYAVSHVITDPPGSVFSKTVYKYFGVVTDGSVRSGKNGYLFPASCEKFDYDADMRGDALFGEDELSLYLSALSARREAFYADGCDYKVFVIPNSQTVNHAYSRLKKTGQTAAEQLEKYLHENGFDGFYLLDSTLSHTKYAPYHNTENAINDYGAYLVYRRICALMPDPVIRRADEFVLSDSGVILSESDGRSLSVEAGLSKLCKNRNVFYETDGIRARYAAKQNGNLTVCCLLDEYNDFIGRSELIFQIPDDYERSLLLPLFASTYTDTVFSGSLSYPRTAEFVTPSACVCIVREDGLSALLDKTDAKSYTSYLEGLANIVPAPEPVTASLKSDGTVIIAGQCPENSYVTVCSASDKSRVYASDGLFIAQLKARKGETLRLYADNGAGTVSDTVTYRTPSAVTAEKSVFAGASSMLYYSQTLEDYTGENLLKADKLALIRRQVEKTRDRIRSYSGKDTQIIILAAPDPLSVYPEAASNELYEKRAAVTRLDQIRSALSDTEGVSFLDVRPVMKENADVGMLYYRTDTHWTELGAYFGYRAIIERISADYPGISPVPFTRLNRRTVTGSPGDLSGFAGLSGIKEKITVMDPLSKPSAVGLPEKPDTIDRSVYGGELYSAVDNAELPVAVMIRDSYSANLFPLIGEHFSYLYAQQMWRYEPEYKKISQLSPDYVIYVICERNLGIFE